MGEGPGPADRTRLTLRAVPASRWAGALGLLLAMHSPLAAQDVFELDEPPETDKRITDTLSYGLEAGLDALRAENLDLTGSGADQTEIEPTFNLALSWVPIPRLRGYLDLEAGYRYEREPDGGSDHLTSLSLREGYLTLFDLLPGTVLQGGRMPFEDPHRWLYDDELDGVRGFWRAGDVGLDASVTRLRGVDLDVFDDQSDEDGTNLFLVARGRFADQLDGSAYVLHRQDVEGSEDLTFVGVQADAEAASLAVRLDAAWVGGTERDDGLRRDVSGFGVDVALTSALDLPLEPSITFGLAFATGDDDPDDGQDHAFRQTGLQENEVPFGGLTRIATYGELVAPELSNLWVWTASAGIRPSRDSSIDLVWHLLRQVEAADELRDTRLVAEPGGASRRLGQEIDLVLSYVGIEDIEAELTFGAFFPGAAFAGDSTAWLVALELVSEF